MIKLGTNFISLIIGLRNSPMFFTNLRDLSSDGEYQISMSTLSVFSGCTNYIAIKMSYRSCKEALLMKSFNIYPLSFPISKLGILIPAPVPSSDMITLFIFSWWSSIIMAAAPPSRAMFLTLVVKWH